MRERREITGGADRPAARDDGDHTAVEQRQQELDRLDAGARVALRERVRAQEHGGPDDLVGVRLSHAARVRAQQPQLQLLGLLLRDRNRHEAAEAGVDAVGVFTASVRGALHELAGRIHPLARPVGEPRTDAVDGHGPDVVHGEVVAREADRRPLRHAASLGVRGGAALALAAAIKTPIESSVKID